MTATATTDTSMFAPETLPPMPLAAKVRRTDSATSHAAAESMTPRALAEQCRKVLWALAELERHGGDGGTAAEVVTRLAYTGRAPQQSVVARRLTDLRERGLIVEDGATRPGFSARPLTVWHLTDAGRAEALTGAHWSEASIR